MSTGTMLFGPFLECLAKQWISSRVFITCQRYPNARPGRLLSYRGDYSQLAIEPLHEPSVQVMELLKRFTDIVNTGFRSYGGGSTLIPVRPEIPLWVSRHGQADGIMIVGLKAINNEVFIQTSEEP